MARVFFVLFACCGVLGFAVGLYPVEATVGPSTFGFEAWVLSTEIDSPLRYECGSALARIEYVDHAGTAPVGMLEQLTGPRLMAGCDSALRPWTLGTVFLLAASSLFLALSIISAFLWMLFGTLRLVGRAAGLGGKRRTERPVSTWS